jgi:hypothetical protein
MVAFLRRLVVCLVVSAAVTAQPAYGRDIYVVLSGGISPFDNNYSQYLQARALAEYFLKHYPPGSVWVFFGAGNVDGQPPVIADVHRQVTRDGAVVDTWLPGALPGNRPATRDAVLGALRAEILPLVAGGGTLYLMVGDHGSRAKRGVRESEIDLWSLVRDSSDDRGWSERDDDALTVSDLRETLAGGLGQGQVVFAMSQCHSGGFHSLAVPRTLVPEDRWFTTPPVRPRRAAPPALVRAAGFTSTDEVSIAAGCNASPDPDHWVGYERLMPERLLGEDLLTRRATGPAARSFADAHTAATLDDQTIDKPYSTSEQYLDRWAALIETQLANTRTLTKEVAVQVAAFTRVVDGAEPQVTDATFRARQAQFRALIARMSEQNPAVRDLLATGSRRQLERAARTERTDSASTAGASRAAGSPRASDRERHRLWRAVVKPAWIAALDAGEIGDVSGAVATFERHLLDEESDKHDFLVDGDDDLRDELYWYSGFGHPTRMDQARADVLAQWAARRSRRILDWAQASASMRVREGAALIAQGLEGDDQADEDGVLSVKTAAARALFERRVLAAWGFLLAMDERAALDRVQELTALERTPLPSSR